MEPISKLHLMLDNYASTSIQDVNIEHLRDSRIFISGATGLIGSALIRALLKANQIFHLNLKIVATVRNIKKAKDIFSNVSECGNLDLVEWNLDNEITCPFADIDYAVHTAAMTSSKDMVVKPVEVMATTFDGTLFFLEFLKTLPQLKKAVVLSSLEVYGVFNNIFGAIEEHQYGYLDILSVRSSYPMAKRAMECLAKAFAVEYNIPVCIARLAQTFGVGVDYNDSRVFAEFARCVVAKKDIILRTEGKTERNYCALSDAVRAIISLLSGGIVGDAYNVAGSDTYSSIFEMANIFAAFSNNSSNVIIKKENASLYGYAPEMKIKLDTQKLASLGFCSKTNLQGMVRETIEWFEALQKERI